MKRIIEEEDFDSIMENLKEVDKLLTERISAMNNVPELLQARHCYIYYRSFIMDARCDLVGKSKTLEETKS